MSQIEWSKVHSYLKSTVGDRLFSTWLEKTSLESVETSPEGKVYKIGVPGHMHREWIDSNLMQGLSSAISVQDQEKFQIELVVVSKVLKQEELLPSYEEQYASTIGSHSSSEKAAAEVQQKLGFLNPQLTFNTFVVGQGNQIAHAACHSVSENPGKQYNPLYLCGPSGLGKTHLLNAIGNAVRQRNPGSRICFVNGERFLTDFVSSIRHGQMDKFRKRYREACDLLIIDDIHVFAHKEGLQEEFFHTFNAHHDNGKQLVFSSDKFPKEISGLEERIRTRLEWGTIVDIQPPDIETRMAILRYKAESSGLFIPDNVVYLIAQISKRSVRELEGHLSTLKMYSELNGTPITYDFAQDVFSRHLNEEKSSGLTIEDIQKYVADSFGVSTKDLKSKSRVQTIVEPRQVAMYLCRSKLDLGVVEIGRAFGGRDHTTVLHAINKVKDDLVKNSELSSKVKDLENKINNSQWISG
ncbi:MAG: chromosomal replication initiator protein DnaA [Oligoflexia bacterium]|nr:chromosomal replication initiator protein DnaA [Oligoflexia bacterium]